jgi:hypothetical protein
MGEGWEGTEASENNGLGSCQTHYVGISPQEDRSSAEEAVGEGEGGEEEVGRWPFGP